MGSPRCFALGWPKAVAGRRGDGARQESDRAGVVLVVRSRWVDEVADLPGDLVLDGLLARLARAPGDDPSATGETENTDWDTARGTTAASAVSRESGSTPGIRMGRMRKGKSARSDGLRWPEERGAGRGVRPINHGRSARRRREGKWAMPAWPCRVRHARLAGCGALGARERTGDLVAQSPEAAAWKAGVSVHAMAAGALRRQAGWTYRPYK